MVRKFDEEPSDAMLERMAELVPREMRRACMPTFGNAKLARRGSLICEDLPEPGRKRSSIGFVQ